MKKNRRVESTPKTTTPNLSVSVKTFFAERRSEINSETLAPKEESDRIDSGTSNLARTSVRRPRSGELWGKHGDYYGWRMHVAWEAIASMGAPDGLLRWLQENALFLYQTITLILPDKIDQAWNHKVSFQQFDALCFEFAVTYQRAIDLYESLKRPSP